MGSRAHGLTGRSTSLPSAAPTQPHPAEEPTVMADQITISLPDGSSRTLLAGSTAADLAAEIGSRLAKAAVAATVDGGETDLTTPLHNGATVAIITADT